MKFKGSAFENVGTVMCAKSSKDDPHCWVGWLKYMPTVERVAEDRMIVSIEYNFGVFNKLFYARAN